MAALAVRRVPVDTGALRSTIHAEPPKVSGTVASVDFACGGPAASYAAVVENDLTKRHKNGQAKFMSTSVDEVRPRIPGMVRRALREGK